ncbi:hypothetical protein MKQ70_00070 [Chitinophaga sedimenti]|uniref:hypothetical protein n=1 Tax=Chitinophaga sedimenti TaxID=2033606 RepID=UPI002006876C|nr:hypothetical protein [Chitinophaga sedimenti]MCK7553483.1 hypothetical protein [Chitinophaga sedimenti]
MKQKYFNALTHGASGKFGDICVFNQRNGSTCISKIPARRPGRGTQNQQRARGDFGDANAYAMEVLKDDYRKGIYQQVKLPGCNVQNMAVKDFFRAPEIMDVRTGEYTGVKGSPIKIWAKDNVRVETVTVAIYDAYDNLLETGAATVLDRGKTKKCKSSLWEYTAAATGNAQRVVVTALDMPGNAAVAEFQLEQRMPQLNSTAASEFQPELHLPQPNSTVAAFQPEQGLLITTTAVKAPKARTAAEVSDL